MNYYGTLYLKLLYGAISYNPSKIRGGTRCPLQNPWWNTMSVTKSVVEHDVRRNE